MKSPKIPPAPAPPDPVATARAQSGMNRETAIAQAGLNMINQSTPDGSLSYRQIGNWSDGTPRYEATQTYSPEQQRLNDLNNQTQAQIGQIGLDQSKRIGNLLSQPVNLNNDAVESRLYDLGSKRLDPRFAQQEETLRTRLKNSGIQQGSEAWDREMASLNQGKNDAYNQLLLQGRGQAVQETLTERNQPINEITALLNGSQVSQPNFVNAPQTNVAGVDYTGLVSNNYSAQMNAWNAQNQQRQAQQSAMMGGLFGLAAAPFQMFRFSDRRLKRDIERVGTLASGLPVYSYRYVWGGPRRLGVMANDVLRVRPEAVREIGGYLAVNYGAL